MKKKHYLYFNSYSADSLTPLQQPKIMAAHLTGGEMTNGDFKA